RGFQKEGFEIVAAFDIDPKRPRDKKITQPILGMDRLAEIIRARGVKMAILTVAAASAQEVANLIIQCGITGILNFAPIVLHVPEEVMVNNVNLAMELENLSYFIQEYHGDCSSMTKSFIFFLAFAFGAATLPGAGDSRAE